MKDTDRPLSAGLNANFKKVGISHGKSYPEAIEPFLRTEQVRWLEMPSGSPRLSRLPLRSEYLPARHNIDRKADWWS